MIIEGNVIRPDDGMVLTNGETYSDCVYLGIHDSPSNWHEIPQEDVPGEDPELDDAEALSLLLGGGEL